MVIGLCKNKGRLLQGYRVVALWLLVMSAANIICCGESLARTDLRARLDLQPDGTCFRQNELTDAWLVAYRFLESARISRQRDERSHGERVACLAAVMRASLLVAHDPRAGRVFTGAEEVFLLLVAQGVAESGGNPRAVSSQHDLGWAQINVTMLRALQVWDPFDVEENAAGQARHMRALLANLWQRWRETKSDQELIELALAAYNASSRAVADGTIPQNGVTPRYVRRTMMSFIRLRRELAELRRAQILIPIG